MNNKELQEITSNLKAGFGKNLWGVVLFGSAARGEQARDIDILIITDNLPQKFMDRMRYIKELIPSHLRGGVSIIAKTKEEFENSFPSYYLDIGIDGIILYEKNHYLTDKLNCIKELIQSSGLRRKRINGSFIWQWTNPPASTWKIDWSGVYGL